MSRQTKFKTLLTGDCQSHQLATINLGEKIERELKIIEKARGFYKIVSLSHSISVARPNTTLLEGSAIITYEMD